MVRSAIAGSPGLEGLDRRQLIYVGVGLVVILVTAAIDYRFWASLAKLMYGFAVVALLGIYVYGTAAFGSARWLEISVRAAGGGEFTTLTPRQPLTPSPYALYAPNAGAAATAATATTANSATTVAAGGVANAGLQADAVTTDKIANGTIIAADVAANTFWKADGNAGTTGGTQFLGTTDNQPLELKVNNTRGLRLEPTADGNVNLAGGNATTIAAGTASVGGLAEKLKTNGPVSQSMHWPTSTA